MLRKYLDAFFEERIEEIANLSEKDEIREELKKKERELVEKLDEEGQRLYLEYESLSSSLESIVRSNLYKKGFFDAIKISRFFK